MPLQALSLCLAVLLTSARAQDIFLAQAETRDTASSNDALRPLRSGEIRLRTANYNVFGRWFGVTGYEGQDERLQAIPAAIAGHPKLGPDVDVITVEEAWCPDEQLVSGRVMCRANEARDMLIAAMGKYGWPYHTAVVDSPGVSVLEKQANGGSIVFSKWPILATSQYVYDSCTGQDCRAAKGAVYVRIEKTDPETGVSQVFNIFGSHLQAWSTAAGQEARKGQMREVHDVYLPALGIPSDGSEAILFQGDMNTDFVLYPDMVDFAEATLRAELPAVFGSQLFSSDPSTNFLVGKDGAAEKGGCLEAYQYGLNVGQKDNGVVPTRPNTTCSNIPTTTAAGGPLNPLFLGKDGHLNVGENCKAYCPCCPHEFLDYITYASEPNKYLQPVSSSLEIVPLKSSTPLSYKWGWCDGAGCVIDKKQSHDITGGDLSDHYPVVANFIFRPVVKTFPMLDGCKTDADCHFEASLKAFCYCTGPGCSWKNGIVNGWDAGSSHPVNNNCHFRTAADSSCFCRPAGH